MTDGRWDLRTALLAALVTLSALVPPELSPAGSALAVTFAAGLAVLSLFSRGAPEAPAWGRKWVLPVLSAYLLLSVLLSWQPHRSLSCLLGVATSVIAFLAARREAREDAGRELLHRTFVAVATVAAAYGLQQRFFGLAAVARDLRRSGLPELDATLIRAESGRAFGPFLLPSALGVYLALALPLTLLLALRRRAGGKLRPLWLVALLIQVGGIGATLSYGAVAALVLAILILLCAVPPPGGRALALGTAAAGLATGLAFLAVRSGEGSAPLLLRWRNWVAAARIFTHHPLFGVGFGNFVDAYPKQMGPGMNETAYAHNSYLQAAAEGGILVLVWIAYGITVLARAYRRRNQPGTDRLRTFLLLLPPVTFLVHNLVDFSAYLPSLSIAFGALLGLALPGESRSREREQGARPRLGYWRLALLLIILGGAAWGLRDARARLLMEEGRRDLEAGRTEAGFRALSLAARLEPGHPDPPALLAEVYLSRGLHQPGERRRGEQWARLAVSGRPQRAYGHYVLALYRLAAGDRGEAWLEISRARRLFPEKDLYRREASRLRGTILPDADGESRGGS